MQYDKLSTNGQRCGMMSQCIFCYLSGLSSFVSEVCIHTHISYHLRYSDIILTVLLHNTTPPSVVVVEDWWARIGKWCVPLSLRHMVPRVLYSHAMFKYIIYRAEQTFIVARKKLCLDYTLFLPYPCWATFVG